MSGVHVRLREWQTAGPEQVEALRGARLGGPGARSLARRLAKEQILEVDELHDGLRVRTRAHVGRVQLGELTVTIEPKLGAADLLELLRYAYGLRALKLFEPTPFATAGRILQDLLIAQLLAEAREIVERGLRRAYVARSEALPSPRGRIDMIALARAATVPLTALPCRHTVRSSDHLLNTVLRAGLELGARLAQDTALKGAVRGLVAHLADDVGPVRLDEALLRRAFRALDRLTRAYEPALRLIEVLLACSAMSLEGEETTALRGFLFDMNRFFQALVGKLLRENLEGLTVDEERGLAMMRYLDGFNPRRRRAPTPRPDFIVREDRKAVAILDAKYRELWEKDLPREMLYQLAMYALAQGRGATAAIVYPTLSAAAVEAVIEIVEPIERRPVGRVALRPLVLPELVAAIRSGERTKASQGIARRLALGQESP